jgi:protein-disulfide isomerase
MKQLLEEYPNDVRWVWRHFPLEQLHDNARVAALATECAGEQGKFWELLDYMMEQVESSEELAEEGLPAMAQSVGVTSSVQFKTCLTEKKFNQKVDDDIADAATAGGRGTPYSVIIGPNGEKDSVSGAQPYAAVKAAVEKYL